MCRQRQRISTCEDDFSHRNISCSVFDSKIHRGILCSIVHRCRRGLLCRQHHLHHPQHHQQQKDEQQEERQALLLAPHFRTVFRIHLLRHHPLYQAAAASHSSLMMMTMMIVVVVLLPRCFHSQPSAASAAVTSSTVCLTVATDCNLPVSPAPCNNIAQPLSSASSSPFTELTTTVSNSHGCSEQLQ